MSVKTYSYPIAARHEVQDYDRARRDYWEREPCQCKECFDAHVHGVPQRFVPIQARGVDERRCRDANQASYFCLGEWLHGWQLRRWLDAKAQFRAAFGRVGPKPMERGPGEDDA